MASHKLRFRASVNLEQWHAAQETNHGGPRKIAVVGDCPELGEWHLHASVDLEPVHGDLSQWESEDLEIAADRFPLRFRFVMNGHRSSPTTRPLLFDTQARTVERPPEDGVVRTTLDPTSANSSTGWVTREGAGAVQLRVGQHNGSSAPLVELRPDLRGIAYRVDLFEAYPKDPNVPEGKAFHRVTSNDVGLHVPEDGDSDTETLTFVMNAQEVDGLVFRVDVRAVDDGRLLARGVVTRETISKLEGRVALALVDPTMRPAGTFRASFLVVKQFTHPNNHLGDIMRHRWAPGGGSLDIGHRGAGESQTHLGKLVRENTMLSFLTSANSRTMEYVEFDVHMTADGEIVIYHDFEIKVLVGRKTVLKQGLPSLTLEQLQSRDVQSHLNPHHHATHRDHLRHKRMFEKDHDRRTNTMKRCASSGETVFRDPREAWDPNQPHKDEDDDDAGSSQGKKTHRKAASAALRAPPLDGSGMGQPVAPPAAAGAEPGGSGAPPPTAPVRPRWRIHDRMATLRELFRKTPRWLGFNIEIKYPTDQQKQRQPFRMYPRNEFIDAILNVVFEEAKGRKIIFSSFDADCATLVSLKQPRYPVFFLTCSGTEVFADPRMNSLNAAVAFARASELQGCVVKSDPLRENLDQWIETFHRNGLYLFTWGHQNNDYDFVKRQKSAGVDAVISDELFKFKRMGNRVGADKGGGPSDPATSPDVLDQAPGGPWQTKEIVRPPSLKDLEGEPQTVAGAAAEASAALVRGVAGPPGGLPTVIDAEGSSQGAESTSDSGTSPARSRGVSAGAAESGDLTQELQKLMRPIDEVGQA
ncbi:unnamed protein product [Pedinophyceae sp. YPF-701]|nr:unnamed protein product [Pedinophyceae sp. YPF-701]